MNGITLGPQWRAVQREAQLAAEQIAHGVTALGRANHAETGRYAQAFFGLSIGLERMGKLVFLADYAIGHPGHFPTDADLRKIGHDLSGLLPRCEEISKSISTSRQYATRPNDPIHAGIEETLSQFAKTLRYYNLSYLAGSAVSQADPVGLWWSKVAQPICSKHYSDAQRQKDQANAAFWERTLDGNAVVIHTAEDGSAITNIAAFASRPKMTSVVQKYGRLYTLQIVRWLASILFELSHTGAYQHRISALMGLHEPFTIFLNDDATLRDTKSWSIYPR